MSLPSRWVEELFSRLTVRYGASFLRQYEGLETASVKADWAKVLWFFADQPEAISAALESLPSDFPPNAMQFRDAALKHAKPVERPMLPGPSVTREQVEAAKAACKRLAAEIQTSGPSKAWAYRLMQREIDSQGVGMDPAQRDMWRDALEIPRRMPAEDAMLKLAA